MIQFEWMIEVNFTIRRKEKVMSLKKNFIYSSILTTSQYLFPLLTYPYVSRVLGVTNIGVVNYVDSLVNYFILFSMLGMSVIGIREIATANVEKESLSRAFWGLFALNGVTTLIALIALIVCIYTIPEFYQYKSLLYIGIIKLVGNFCLIDWFYKGVENFKYITNRTILIKFLYVISVFVFIHKAEDYNIYFFLTVLTVGINALFNIGYVFNFIEIRDINFNIAKYLKPFVTMGIYQVLTSMYTSFNVAFLGWTINTTQVGYYTTATKIFGLILALYGAFTGVMLPRMSSLLSANKREEFKNYISKSTDFMLILNFPIVILGIIFAPQIIRIVSGAGYEGAIIPFQITMVLLLLVGYDQIQIIQVLMPLKNDKAILVNSTIGAIVGILANLLLVCKYQAIGSTLVLIISEMAVMFTARYFIKRSINIELPVKAICMQISYHVPLIVIFVLLKQIISNQYWSFYIALLVIPIYFFILQYYIVKNEVIVNVVSLVASYFKKKKQ